MADIAGLGNPTPDFGANQTRSVPETQPRETAARSVSESETFGVNGGGDGAAAGLRGLADEPAARTATDTQVGTAEDGSGEGTESTRSAPAAGGDEVSLSADAESALAGPGAAGSTAASDEGAAAPETNQVTRLETSTAEVNGNQDNQSEATRTLGQVVDQFA